MCGRHATERAEQRSQRAKYYTVKITIMCNLFTSLHVYTCLKYMLLRLKVIKQAIFVYFMQNYSGH